MTQNYDDLLAADSAARQTALDATRSFIIDAPAGAGKTELLTQRFLVLLSHVDDPEEIIALTFTNKAAAEMRARIMNSLLSATRPLPPDAPPHKAITYRLACAALERDALCGWQLLQQPERLRVLTLDALAARIARQMPLLSRFGTQPAISDDATPHYAQAVQNTLAQLEDRTPASDTVAAALAYFENDAGRLQSMLIAMLARRDQWLRHVFGNDEDALQEAVSQALTELIRQRLSLLAERIPARRQETFMAAARTAAELSPESSIALLANWQTPLSADPAQLPQWRALADLLLTGAGELRKSWRAPINLAGPKNKETKDTLLAAIADLAATDDGVTLAALRELPEPLLDADAAQTVNHFAALLRLAAAELWLIFIREKVVDFSEIASRAVAAFGDDEAPGELRERLDYRLSHLLVDEFQDTSPQQVTLLERLTAGWADDTERHRSLLLVGDPMQSIYRFRKAEVGLFLHVRQHGLGALKPQSLQLYRNNRSHPEIIDWVNRTFAQVFAPRDDIVNGAVRYAASVPGKTPGPLAGVQLHPVIIGDANDTDDIETKTTTASLDASMDAKTQAADTEAALIVQLIHDAHRDNPDGTVAVLVRARSHLNALVTQLGEAGIAFQAVEIDALAERQSVQDLVALTRALHHRADRLHWLAVLRAPWCGLTLADLHDLAADDHQQTIWALMHDDARLARLSDDGRARLLALRQVFADAYAEQGVQRPRRWVEGIWHGLNGPACLRNASDVADAQAYFQLLDSLDVGGRLELDRLDTALARLFAAPDANPDSHHVQLMTIHKAKGLEFDTVILPGLHRTTPSDARPLLLWDNLLADNGSEQLIVAPAPPPGPATSNVPTPYELLRSLERTRSQNEAKRLLYVAVTRAIRRLHLIGAVRRADADTFKTPAAGSLLAPLWPALAADFARAPPVPPASPSHALSASAIDPAQFVPQLVRLAMPNTLPEAASDDTDDSLEQESASLFASTLDMDIGTLIHRYLEAFARDGLQHWDGERLGTLLPRFVAHFAALGHMATEAEDAAVIVRDTLTRALTDEQSRWLLSPHTDAACEVPLSSLLAADETSDNDGTDYRHHIIDRTFIADGIRWIIDYKTVRLNHDAIDAAQLDALLQAKADRYRPQLARYAALYAHEKAQGLRIRTAIFFPAHGKLIELAD